MWNIDSSTHKQVAMRSRPPYFATFIMIGLLLLAHVLTASEGERRLIDVVIVLTFYGWLAVRPSGKE
jgi:hypothetical protein